MSIPARAEAVVKGLTLWAGLGVAVLGIVFIALGFLIAGFFLWVARHAPHDAAAAITGGVLLLIAIIVLLIGRTALKRMKRRQPPLMSEFTGILISAGRIAGLLIRKDPRKSLVLAVIAGAVAEYITSGDKRKK
jgi:hypothetical protein